MASPETTEHKTSMVWVTWQSPDTSRISQGRLGALNQDGFVVLHVSDAETLWLPHGRVYCISTRASEAAGTVMEEQTAVQAAAVIEAVAQDAAADFSRTQT